MLRANDPIQPPENADITIWRYMDFTKFVAMLEKRGLFFTRACYLDDPFEGSYSRANEVLRPQVYRVAGMSPEDQKRMFGQHAIVSQHAPKWVLVNCWHINE